MNIEIFHEDNRSDTGKIHVFQIYDCWSAEEMKNLSCLRLAFRNASRWFVVSRSTEQVRGASIVNRRISMGAELVFRRHAGEFADEYGRLAGISMSYFILNKAWCFSQHGF